MESKPAENQPPVIIVPYQPGWKWKFRLEAVRIRFLLGKKSVSIHHIGSTSVSGLAAKPIIDILIGVKSLEDTPFYVEHLSRLGYTYWPEYEADLPERRYFNRPGFHIHMVEPASSFYLRHLAFRDYLRAHPEAAAEYAALKIELAKQFGSDREGYTDAKTEFIQSIERKARQ